MAQRVWSGWIYVVAPPILLVVAAGLFLAFGAARENIRLGGATDQVVGVVRIARDMRFQQTADPTKGLNDLLNRLSTAGDRYQPVIVAPEFMGKPAERGLENPWHGAVRLSLYPSVQSIRLESEMPSHACRRILRLFAKDIGPLGIRRVDVKDDTASSLWRLVYEESAQNNAPSILDQTAIEAGCGNEEQTIVSLTFRLR